MSHSFLFVLNPGQSRAELRDQLAQLIDVKKSIEIARGEIELKKVRSSLIFLTNGATTSLTTLAALDLPGRTAALLWLTNALVKEPDEISEIKHFVEKRNRDARVLLQSLETIHLKEWFEALVTVIDPVSLPAHYRFPPGHPYPKKFYHQHPLAALPNNYYPVDSFFALLREEREIELMHLLASLGAARIDVQEEADLANSDHATRTLRSYQFNGIPWSSALTIDHTRYHWLEYEPSWQTAINSRIQHQCLSISLESTSDFSCKIASLAEAIVGVAESFESIEPIDSEALLRYALQPRKILVRFPGA